MSNWHHFRTDPPQEYGNYLVHNVVNDAYVVCEYVPPWWLFAYDRWIYHDPEWGASCTFDITGSVDYWIELPPRIL